MAFDFSAMMQSGGGGSGGGSSAAPVSSSASSPISFGDYTPAAGGNQTLILAGLALVALLAVVFILKK